MQQWINDYNLLVKEAISTGDLQFNERTGQHIRCLTDGTLIQIDLNTGFLPIPANRAYFCKSSAAELAWIVKGTKHVEWLNQYTKMWEKFANQDGIIQDAYGHRLQFSWFNQIERVIDMLHIDKSTRRAVLNIWSPMDLHAKKTAPCPTQMILTTNSRGLTGHLVIRSSDVFVGLPYDVMVWSMFVRMIANSTGFDNCFLTVFIANLHIYENHIPLFEDREDHRTEVPMHPFTFDQLKERPERLIEWTTSIEERFWPKPNAYNPKPEVFE